MIRAVTRLILLLLICLCAHAETLDDAVRALGKKVMTRLGPDDAPRVTARTLTSLAPAEVLKAQATLDRSLRRRLRNPTTIDVALTISENLRGYLLVAEIHHDNATLVEMVDYRPDPPTVQPRPAVALERRLLWEQSTPILDAVLMSDQIILLDTTRLDRYERSAAKWELKETSPIPPVSVRDPRGRLELSGDMLSVELPGLICKGTWKPMLTMQCEEGGRFSTARNTVDYHDGHAPSFNAADIAGQRLIAEVDGRTHIYDASNNAAGSFDVWGSDFVPVKDSCAGSYVAATAQGDRKSVDSIALYSVIDGAPFRVSDPAEFPGPVTALWPAATGATAVVRNLSTGNYAAYALSVDCGR
jgi:hypothetical protein